MPNYVNIHIFFLVFKDLWNNGWKGIKAYHKGMQAKRRLQAVVWRYLLYILLQQRIL